MAFAALDMDELAEAIKIAEKLEILSIFTQEINFGL
jgi:translation elongation factor EF-1beta